MASTNTMDKAAAAFKKQQQAREGEKAMAEYRAAQLAEEAKTERLRALRLAREAAPDTAAAPGAALEGEEPAPTAKAMRAPAPRKQVARRGTTRRKRR